MQQFERKYFADPQSGALNADDASFSVAPNQWVNMENARTGSTDNGVIQTVESIGSTLLLSTPQPSVTFITIGAVEDTENSRICFFKYNTTGPWHKIVCYDQIANIEYDVLLSSQVTGGLNFSKNSIIHSAKIVNGLLYWPDGTNNQPRKINIEAGIKANYPSFVTNAVAYTFPLNFSEITLIKPPPSLTPNITKNTDGSFNNNFIANDSFEYAYQYIYYDNEITVVGAYSPSSRLNAPTDTFNRIVVSMDYLEAIPSTVRIVNLIVRYDSPVDGLPTNIGKVIKTWDKEVASENTEIANQNNGTQVLTFNFYNNSTGATLAQDDVLRPFDSVPIYSGTMEVAKNRTFLANNTEGYDTPTTTSLSSTNQSVNINGTVLSKNLISVTWEWWNFSFNNPPSFPSTFFGGSYSAWYVYIGATDGISPIGYYAITSTEQTVAVSFHSTRPYPPNLSAAPTSIIVANLTFKGATQADVLTSTGYAPIGFVSPALRETKFTTTSNIVSITGVTVKVYNIFKSSCQYKFGIVFYDFAMRKCGVVTNDGLIFSIPKRTFEVTGSETWVNGVFWSLSNANALTEIPDWAYYYAVVRTLNQRTRFFVQAYTNAIKYVTKDADGKYVFTNTIYSTSAVGIGLDTTALVQAGLGYVFNEGDICILSQYALASIQLPVIAQDGNYIIVQSKDIGNTATALGTQFIFEIYSPYQTSNQEPFYEIGEMYRVLNPGTSSRAYETLSDVFAPDAYIVTRNYKTTTYFAEAMSPNDSFYKRWDNDGGKVNFITKLGQVAKTQYISFSDTFIPNTAVNGLSTFRALNQKSVPQDCGTIRKLQLTSKVQSEGTVMLSICTVETNSMYLGETQITDATGATQFFSESTSVISTINTLKGGFGTTNAEGVIEYRGNVFWPNVGNGKFIQYSANGLFPVSNYKMTRFWKLFSQQFASMTATEIEALGGRPFIFCTIDPHHNELLISIPKLLAVPPKGYLPDYPEVIYPFDIYDGQSKTIVYKLGQEGGIEPHWQGSYSFCAETFITLQNKLYSFKQGNLYLHNQTTLFNQFYGVTYKSKIMFVSNMIPITPKVYNNIGIESNMCPTFTYLYNEYPYQQSSDLVDYDFKNLEGIFYAAIYRNKLIPTAVGYNTNGLLTGEKMRNVAMFLMLEFTVNATPLELKFVNIGFALSRGHNS